MPFELGFDPGAWLDQISRSLWLRQLGIVIGATLLSWPLARFLAARLGHERGSDRQGAALPWLLLHAAIWPLAALAVSAAALEVWRSIAPATLGDSRGVLPILGFFLLWSLINTLILELVPKGGARRRTRRGLVPLLFSLVVLQQLGLLGPLVEFLQRPLITFRGTNLTVFAMLVALAVVLGASLVAQISQAVLGRTVLPRLGVEFPVAEAIGTVARYVLVLIGLMWALEIVGFDLTTLKIAFGALGIGIGFGLQNIVNNFTSGLILLFERSVKRGDVLTVDGTDGRVQRIGLRSSVLRTRAGDDLIMPNSMLVENMVTNYSFSDELKRVDVDVGVSYAADPNTVRELLLEVGRRCEGVLEHPEPSVLFLGFGDSSIDFQLRVWIPDAWQYPRMRSALLFDTWYALKAAGIEIPFPQRDLHLRSGELPVRRVGEQAAGEQ